MIAILAAVAALQAMPQAELIREGEQIGRASVAMGICSRMGYTVHSDTGERWAEGFGRRALASGWSEDVALAAVLTG